MPKESADTGGRSMNRQDQIMRRITKRVVVLITSAILAVVAVIPWAGYDDAVGQIRFATGSGVTTLPEPQGPFFDVAGYGALSGGSAVANQTAINAAITAAAAAGGGTVVVP